MTVAPLLAQPAPIFTDQVSGDPIDPRLDPQAREVATAAARSGGLPADMAAKRAAFDRVFAELAGPPEPVAEARDLRLPGAGGNGREIRVRLYRPAAAGPVPVVVYTHGGGFEKGSLASHDAPLRMLVNRCGCAIVAVDYPLAPESKFPAQTDAAFAALRWVGANGASLGLDPGRIAVAGDSVGGNLAALNAIRARDEGGPRVEFQVLLYPVTDLSLGSESWRRFAQGPWLSHSYETNALGAQYLPAGVSPADPRVSPLNAELKGLPAAFVANAEFDGYRDEGQAYTQRLRAAGVPATWKVYPGQVHDFFLMAGKVDAARTLVDDVASELRRAFGLPAQ